MILSNVYLTFPDINLIYALTSNFGPDYLQIMLMWVTAVFLRALHMSTVQMLLHCCKHWGIG